MNRTYLVVLAALLVASLVTPIPTVRADNPAIAIAVDASANRRPINPLIYGLAYADGAQLADLRCPSNRRGGNNTTRYNWQQNADNRANDWYYQSIAYSSSTAGADADAFVDANQAANAESMITIPTVGWVAKLGPNRTKLSSFSIMKYGAQTGNDWQWFPDAGNGIRASNNQPITGNDPNDASVPADVNFQRGWVQHLVAQQGTAANGGVRYYLLDNEPSIWFSTHRDVKPTGPTMDEIRDKTIQYGTMIKDTDPGALVVGEEMPDPVHRRRPPPDDRHVRLVVMGQIARALGVPPADGNHAAARGASIFLLARGEIGQRHLLGAAHKLARGPHDFEKHARAALILEVAVGKIVGFLDLVGLFEQGVGLGGRDALEARVEAQRLAHAQVVVEAKRLGNEAHEAAGRAASCLASVPPGQP